MTQRRAGLEVDLNRSWRHDNVGRMLLGGWGYFEAALMRRVHASGFSMVRHVHFNVLRHLDFDGTRIVDLAARAGITKGSMGQIVRDCELLGLVRLQVDPYDGRAKVVSFDKLGIELMEVIRNAMIDVQKEMTAITGAEEMAVMLRALRLLRSHFTEDESVQAPRISVHR